MLQCSIFLTHRFSRENCWWKTDFVAAYLVRSSLR